MSDSGYVVGSIEFDGRVHHARAEQGFHPAPAAPASLSEFFDLITVPKNSTPGGPVQTSSGLFVHVLMLWAPLSRNIKQLITGARLSKRVTVAEIDKSIALLQAYRTEIEQAGTK